MLFSIPLVLLNLVISFFWLTFVEWIIAKKRKQNEIQVERDTGKIESIGNFIVSHHATSFSEEIPLEDLKSVKDLITMEYRNLGSWSQQEITTAICFSSLVFFWFFRDPKAFPGWAALFPYEVILNLFIHEVEPQSRPVMVTIFTCAVCTSPI